MDNNKKIDRAKGFQRMYLNPISVEYITRKPQCQ